jgi:hypothetical protein
MGRDVAPETPDIRVEKTFADDAWADYEYI